MAISAVVDIARLDEGWILAPERYDPRRRRAKDIGPCLGDFVHVRRDHVNAKTADARRFLVFDTGDAQHGIVSVNKSPCAGTDIRSMKKRIYPHQVIISRLRPYLRQVAWVDPGLLAEQEPDVDLLCSTEFFVLESVADNASIAFLVPFLLSDPIQTILAAAQEGGHHPRFNERTLTTLRIPASLVENAGELSARFEQGVAQAREAYRALRESVAMAARLHAPLLTASLSGAVDQERQSRIRPAGEERHGQHSSR